MTKPNVRLFSEIFYDELDKAAWLFIDPDYFEEIAVDRAGEVGSVSCMMSVA